MLPNPYSLVYQTIPLGELTPSLAYELLDFSPPSFILESIKGSPEIARYSLLGGNPFLIFKSSGYEIEISRGNIKQHLTANPVKELKKLMLQYSLPGREDLPPFLGGAVGYISYDACHFFERLPCTTIDDLQLPELLFNFVDTAVVFDHQQKLIWIMATGMRKENPEQAKKYSIEWVRQTVDTLSNLLFKSHYNKPSALIIPSEKIKSNFTQAEFESVVEQAKEYIRAGDIFQVNLSQRLQSPISGDYWKLYKSLGKINPSPFACYLENEDFTVVSCSPERLVRVYNRQVDTRPIAGTRPRGRNGQEDKALSAELILNEKERAEHIMLVDLERNDMGRICEYGSVRVNELMVIEDYSHVFHIVSNVQGKLVKSKDCFDVLRACFPGGTITGTPKIRSMQIIDELELTRRGLYTGSIGYLSFSGNMDLNIVIRTFIIKDNMAYIQVGCGIVADSEPEREYFETLHKAEALLQTLQFHFLGNTPQKDSRL